MWDKDILKLLPLPNTYNEFIDFVIKLGLTPNLIYVDRFFTVDFIDFFNQLLTITIDKYFSTLYHQNLNTLLIHNFRTSIAGYSLDLQYDHYLQYCTGEVKEDLTDSSISNSLKINIINKSIYYTFKINKEHPMFHLIKDKQYSILLDYLKDN